MEILCILDKYGKTSKHDMFVQPISEAQCHAFSKYIIRMLDIIDFHPKDIILHCLVKNISQRLNSLKAKLKRSELESSNRFLVILNVHQALYCKSNCCQCLLFYDQRNKIDD